jgi:hypothetical protein
MIDPTDDEVDDAGVVTRVMAAVVVAGSAHSTCSSTDWTAGLDRVRSAEAAAGAAVWPARDFTAENVVAAVELTVALDTCSLDAVVAASALLAW